MLPILQLGSDVREPGWPDVLAASFSQPHSSSKPLVLNVGLTELLTPGMLNYSVEQTSVGLELLRE